MPSSSPTSPPAASEPVPAGRVVFRPWVLLVFSSVVSVVFVVACLYGWYAIGDVRSQFTGLQVGTLVLFIVWIVGLIMAMALSVVVVEESRLVVRNGVVTRRYAFSDIRAVRYREGDSWAYLELHETGTAGEHLRRQCLAIQRVDGARSRADAARLRDLIRARR